MEQLGAIIARLHEQMDPNIPQCLPALITKLQRCVDTLELERSAAFDAAEQPVAKDAELNAKDEAVLAATAATAHSRKRHRQGDHLYITKHTTINLSCSAAAEYDDASSGVDDEAYQTMKAEPTSAASSPEHSAHLADSSQQAQSYDYDTGSRTLAYNITPPPGDSACLCTLPPVAKQHVLRDAAAAIRLFVR
eukprot:9496-Heterococcus_DN1.PRE.2